MPKIEEAISFHQDAEQLISAIDRFYAMTGYYPWNAAVGDSAEMPWTEADTENLLGLQTPFTACPVLYRLSEVPTASAEDCNNEPGTQELKLGFVSKLDAESDNPLFIFHGPNSSDSTYVCFAPQSNAFQQEAAERVSGSLPGDYPVADAVENTTNCGTQGNCICLP